MFLLKQKGFTLIELIVVISIMSTMAAILIVNFNGQRSVRNLRIGQNEMVTNIRKSQSYILSSRDTVTGGVQISAKYYVLLLNTNSSQYFLQSIDDNYVLNPAVETLTLPQNIIISGIQYTNPGGPAVSVTQSQLVFSAPYGKLFINTNNDSCPGSASLEAVVKDNGCMLNLADRRVTVTLQDRTSGVTKTVSIYGVSGKVEAGP